MRPKWPYTPSCDSLNNNWNIPWTRADIWRMPVSGLPSSLEDLLGTVIQKSTVKSWQIYSEKDGVTFRIKFSNTENGAQAVDGNIAYVKKPPSKLTRDKERVSQRITRSKAKQQGSIEIPRDMDYSPSVGNSALRPYSHVGLGQSPMSVADQSSPEQSSQHDYIISPDSHDPFTMCSQNINSTMLSGDHNMPALENSDDLESMNNSKESIADDLSDHMDDQDSDTETLPDMSVTQGCNVRGCFYRDTSIQPPSFLEGNQNMSVCTKCSGTKTLGRMFICESCNVIHKKHQRHKQYLISVTEYVKLKKDNT